MESLFFQKAPHGIVLPDEESIEIFKNFSAGDVFKANHWKARNYLFHRKLFALAQVITRNNPRWPNPYELIKAVQLDIGSTDLIKDLEGNVKKVPKSLKFEKMGEVEFSRLFSDFADVLMANLYLLLPGMSKQAFHNQVLRILSFT